MPISVRSARSCIEPTTNEAPSAKPMISGDDTIRLPWHQEQGRKDEGGHEQNQHLDRAVDEETARGYALKVDRKGHEEKAGQTSRRTCSRGKGQAPIRDRVGVQATNRNDQNGG